MKSTRDNLSPIGRRKLVFLYAIIVVNTALMLFNLFITQLPSHATFNFLCCSVAWLGVVLVERAEDIRKQFDSDSDSSNPSDKEDNDDG